MSSSARKNKPATYVEGSTLRHILVLTSTSSLGLAAIFVVDLLDMYFLSLLGEIEVAAAIGYAGSILFFTVSIGIGMSIAAGALVSRALGSGQRRRAQRLTTNILLYALILGTVLAVLIWIFVPELLGMLGAKGRAHQLAVSYLRILIPTLPILAAAICTTALLRAAGDAKRAMYVTLIGGFVNLLLDPLFIFTFDLGVDGAALASVCARFSMFVVGLWGVLHIHRLAGPTSLKSVRRDAPAMSGIALPAVLTNIATPVGNAVVTSAISDFGDGAVAGWAIVGRIIPVAFGVVFALSGAVGPILGQNLGAKKFGRLSQTMIDALKFNLSYIVVAWILLGAASGFIVSMFSATGDAAALIRLFCHWLNPLFGFFGLLFIANAAFNNLGRPHYSTLFNWGRATLGTIPLVTFGASLHQAQGAMFGYLLTGVLFGSIAFATAMWHIRRLTQKHEGANPLKQNISRA